MANEGTYDILITLTDPQGHSHTTKTSIEIIAPKKKKDKDELLLEEIVEKEWAVEYNEYKE